MSRGLVALLLAVGTAAAQLPTVPFNPDTPPGRYGPAAASNVPAEFPPVSIPPVTLPPVPPSAPVPIYLPPAPALAPPAPKPSGLTFEPYWNNGLFFRTPNKDFVAHVGGTIQYDAAFYTGGAGVQNLPGGIGRFSDGVNPRRLRIQTDGLLYGVIDYKFDLEFANGFIGSGPAGAAGVIDAPGPTDAYVTLRDVPWVGSVRIGNQKEWFSLEHLESQRMLMFLERSYLFDASQPTAFNTARSPGVSVFRTWANDAIFTAVGVYKNTSAPFGFAVGDGEYAVTGRAAVLPVWLPELQTYWHVGGAMTVRDPVGDAVRVRVRGSVRNAPAPLLNQIADTGTIPTDRQSLYNLETAFASGPLTLSSEYTANVINLHGRRGDAVYHGFYAQAMCFLTGEHREWDPKAGVFKRVLPRCNFDPNAGTWGAWEAGGRIQHLDLDARGINGGRLTGMTLGLNWYWNPNVKLQVNYDYLYRDGGPNPAVKGSIHSLGTRLAMDF